MAFDVANFEDASFQRQTININIKYMMYYYYGIIKNSLNFCGLPKNLRYVIHYNILTLT